MPAKTVRDARKELKVVWRSLGEHIARGVVTKFVAGGQLRAFYEAGDLMSEAWLIFNHVKAKSQEADIQVFGRVYRTALTRTFISMIRMSRRRENIKYDNTLVAPGADSEQETDRLSYMSPFCYSPQEEIDYVIDLAEASGRELREQHRAFHTTASEADWLAKEWRNYQESPERALAL